VPQSITAVFVTFPLEGTEGVGQPIATTEYGSTYRSPPAPSKETSRSDAFVPVVFSTTTTWVSDAQRGERIASICTSDKVRSVKRAVRLKEGIFAALLMKEFIVLTRSNQRSARRNLEAIWTLRDFYGTRIKKSTRQVGLILRIRAFNFASKQLSI